MAELQGSVVDNTVAIANANNICSISITCSSNCNNDNNNNYNNNNNLSLASPVTTLCEDAKWLNEDAITRSAFVTQSEA